MKSFKELFGESPEYANDPVTKKTKDMHTKDVEKHEEEGVDSPMQKTSTNRKKRHADAPDVQESFAEKILRIDSELNETFRPGKMKLSDGKTIAVSDGDAKSLNTLFKTLNGSNKAKMKDKLYSNEDAYSEIIKFAKEV